MTFANISLSGFFADSFATRSVSPSIGSEDDTFYLIASVPLPTRTAALGPGAILFLFSTVLYQFQVVGLGFLSV